MAVAAPIAPWRGTRRTARQIWTTAVQTTVGRSRTSLPRLTQNWARAAEGNTAGPAQKMITSMNADGAYAVPNSHGTRNGAVNVTATAAVVPTRRLALA